MPDAFAVPPAGFYPDPYRPKTRGWRYWNGTKWSNFDPTPDAHRKEVNPPPIDEAILESFDPPKPGDAPKGQRSEGKSAFIIGTISGTLVWGGILHFSQVGVVPTIILTAVAALVTGGVMWSRKQKAESALKGGLTGAFAGLSFDQSTIRFNGQSQPLKGSIVSVETAGALSKRLDVKNMLVGGALLGPVGLVIGARDKVDDNRELYLVVTGVEQQWAVPVKAKDGALARQFAARVTSAAMRS